MEYGISNGFCHIGTNSGICEFVDFECVKYIMKEIRKSFPMVMALSYGKEKENYTKKEYKKIYSGFVFAELYRYGTKNNYDKTTKKIQPGNTVSFIYTFDNPELQNLVFLKMQDLVLQYGNGHFLTYIDNSSKLFLSKKMI